MGSRRWDSVKANYSGTRDSPSPTSMFTWAADVHNTLLSIGMAIESTSLAAQWDFLVSYIPAANTYPWFRIYELNDSLSGTLPIYIKLWFGGHPAQGGGYGGFAHQPQCKVQVGTTVNASGVLGGLVSEEFSVFSTSGVGNGAGGIYSTMSTSNYFHKSNVGLFLFMGGSPGMFAGSYANPALMFYLERLPDANGNPTTNGYTLLRPTPITDFEHGTANGPLSRVAQARTYTAAFDLGAWHTDPCAPIGGGVTASVEGGVNFQPFYHLCPELRPMKGVFGYYSGTIPLYSNSDISLPGGSTVQVKALGGDPASGRSPYGMLVDRFDSYFLLAAVTD